MTKLGRDLMFCAALAALATPAATGDVRADAQDSPPRRQPANSGGRIVVLGDSLAVSPSPTRNFVTELRKRLEDTDGGWTIVNAGVHGDTSANGLKRVNALLTPDTRILILELGANDGLRGVAPSTTEQNLSEIVRRAQAADIHVLLCGMMVPPRYGWDHAVGFLELFPRLAARYNLTLVPFLLQGVALNSELNGPDGVHPNEAGARRIADTVWPYVERLVSAN
jgi:acyl-CoA thioesterase I